MSNLTTVIGLFEGTTNTTGVKNGLYSLKGFKEEGYMEVLHKNIHKPEKANPSLATLFSYRKIDEAFKNPNKLDNTYILISNGPTKTPDELSAALFDIGKASTEDRAKKAFDLLNPNANPDSPVNVLDILQSGEVKFDFDSYSRGGISEILFFGMLIEAIENEKDFNLKNKMYKNLEIFNNFIDPVHTRTDLPTHKIFEKYLKIFEEYIAKAQNKPNLMLCTKAPPFSKPGGRISTAIKYARAMLIYCEHGKLALKKLPIGSTKYKLLTVKDTSLQNMIDIVNFQYVKDFFENPRVKPLFHDNKDFMRFMEKSLEDKKTDIHSKIKFNKMEKSLEDKKTDIHSKIKFNKNVTVFDDAEKFMAFMEESFKNMVKSIKNNRSYMSSEDFAGTSLYPWPADTPVTPFRAALTGKTNNHKAPEVEPT